MDKPSKDLKEIGHLMASAQLLMAVRHEVAKIAHDGFVVTDGGHHTDSGNYDVVVECKSHLDKVARRIRYAIPDVNVERITKGILGVKTRRGKNYRC